MMRICLLLVCLLAHPSYTWAYDQSQCEILAAKASIEDKNVIIENTLPQLSGTWLSQGCETRPGPEYILRVYTFDKEGYYKLIQHHYWDESCSTPKLTIMSHGHMVVSPYASFHEDAMSGALKPTNITITPHDQKAAKKLEELVQSQCREQRWKPWRKYEEHTILNTKQYQNTKPAIWEPSLFLRQNQQYLNLNTQRHIQDTVADFSCLGSFRWAFQELKLIRIQLRPILKTSYKEIKSQPMRLELLLGDVHSRKDFQEHYTSTGFQTPLLKFSKDQSVKMRGKHYKLNNACSICSTLYSSDKTPPHLIKKPQLPAYIWGEWVSMRCESRSMGLFLNRRFYFYIDDSVWVGEHRFYVDPFCTIMSFTVTAAGHFEIPGPSEVIRNSHNIDFNIEKASLTLYNSRMIHDLRGTKKCGTEVWEKGVPQDISLTNGCMPLGIITPSIQVDIVKIEMNYEGSCLLYLGQSDTDNMPRSKFDRPTSFDYPLVKCGDDISARSLQKDYSNSGGSDNVEGGWKLVYLWVFFSLCYLFTF